MSIYEKVKNLESSCSGGYWATRIYAEMCYMTCLSETKDSAYDSRIEEAADYLHEVYRENGVIGKADALHVEDMLSDLSKEAKKLKVFCISHAHIDMNWMWGYNETAAVTVDTFRTVLDLMKEYKDFTYAQSQASTYQIIERFAPEMLDEIKARIHEGRWEVSASTWVEPDKNMPNGESLCRHILYTKRYLSNLFNIDPDSLDMDFEPDTFGHNANVPEICSNGGIKYYYHCRGNDAPDSIYRWRSPSGKEILVHRESKWYNGGISARTFEDIPMLCKKKKSDVYLHVYGVGDHGGGPTRRDIECIIDDAQFPLYPTIEFGTYRKFFAELDKHREDYPIVDRELNFIFMGCYTSQSRIKMSNRISEDRMYESEFLSAAANSMAGAPNRTKLLGDAWKNILFNHFHDILPGSGVLETREYAMGKFQEAMAAINTAANCSMRELSAAMDTSGIAVDTDKHLTAEGGGVGFAVNEGEGFRFPQAERGRGKVRIIHVYNETMYDRRENTEITLWDYNYDTSRMYVKDADGNDVRFEIIDAGRGFWDHTYLKLLIEADVPACGYNTYIIALNERKSINQVVNPIPDYGLQSHVQDRPFVLENEYVKAVFDPMTLAMTSFVDKESGKDLVSPDRPAAMFRFITESTIYHMTSWQVGPYMKVENLNSADRTVKFTAYKAGGMRKALHYEVKFGASKLKVEAELKDGSRIVNFRITADWHERGNEQGIPQLNFYMPVAYKASGYQYDIPMGLIEREDLAHDVPANSFMAVENGDDKAILITTDSKYGFRGTGDSGAVTLIRGSYDPDPYPEYGIHTINIGVGISDKSKRKQLAVRYAHPMSFSSDTAHKGTLPLKSQFIALAPELCDSVMISGIKTAEEGGCIVRLAEYAGRGGKLKLSYFKTPTSASVVDITERHVIKEAKINGNTVETELEPYASITLLIK